jgi:hypothetical protein
VEIKVVLFVENWRKMYVKILIYMILSASGIMILVFHLHL